MRKSLNGRTKVAALFALSAALPLSAIAFENGLYVGLEGGANFEGHQNFQNSIKANEKFKNGWLAGYVTGYAAANGFRPELEIDFRRNQFRKSNVGFVGSFGATGFENVTSGMANLWYDVKTPTGIFSKVHPYIGGGIGLAQVRIQHETTRGVQQIDDSDRVFAYQGGAGIGYEITPHLIWSLDWRYFQTERANFSTRVPAGGNVAALYRSNSAMVGLRYNFGVPPKPIAPYVAPTPEPLPPPAPVGPCRDSDGDGVCDAVDKCPGTPKGFRVDADGCIIDQKIILRSVNFEFNKDVLTAPAKDTLDEVSAALKGQPALRVEIAGYTDSVGSVAYNLNLSKKRAASVKKYLVGKGVAAANLTSQGYGKGSPIASNDTEEGRAENRRVEFSVISKPASADVVTKDSTKASKAAAEGDPVGKKAVKKGKKKKAKKSK